MNPSPAHLLPWMTLNVCFRSFSSNWKCTHRIYIMLVLWPWQSLRSVIDMNILSQPNQTFHEDCTAASTVWHICCGKIKHSPKISRKQGTDIYLDINWWKIQQNMPRHFQEILVFLGVVFATPGTVVADDKKFTWFDQSQLICSCWHWPHQSMLGPLLFSVQRAVSWWSLSPVRPACCWHTSVSLLCCDVSTCCMHSHQTVPVEECFLRDVR